MCHFVRYKVCDRVLTAARELLTATRPSAHSVRKSEGRVGAAVEKIEELRVCAREFFRAPQEKKVVGSSPTVGAKRKSVLERGRIFVCIIHFSIFIIHYSLNK